jgi:hypothetical protein
MNENTKCIICRTYFISKLKTSGLPYKCCDKCREHQKEYYKENADKLKEYKKENADKAKEYKKEYADKLKKYQKEYYKENADKIKEYQKKYKKENADKLKEYKKEYYKIKEYYKENADKIKEQTKKYKKENADKIKEYKQNIKKNNTPLYLVYLQRQQLSRIIKFSNEFKITHSVEYLGCSGNDLKIFLQSKIDLYNTTNDVKMNWDNIHIDHIKPISKFDLDNQDEFLECCHYTNLQPLFIKDNLSKHNKWNDENNEFWKSNILYKDEYFNIYNPFI